MGGFELWGASAYRGDKSTILFLLGYTYLYAICLHVIDSSVVLVNYIMDRAQSSLVYVSKDQRIYHDIISLLGKIRLYDRERR